MVKRKLIDCITFFQENFIFNLRNNTLKNVTDEFVICEANYDHRGRKKKLKEASPLKILLNLSPT